MNDDLTTFKVLMTAGKGLTPAQQAWPPLTLEAYAQLSIKRAQVATLGSMRSINWTDHANVTKQQVLENIDVKHLRWISEIISDGSVIQSLSGRSALLGDGYSRNPSDRDELIAQRTKDLEGIIGQARGFDIDEFLSDWEPTDARPIPWTLPSDTGPAASVNLGKWYYVAHPFFPREPVGTGGILADSSAEETALPVAMVELTTGTNEQEAWSLPRLMMTAGLAPKVTALYLPDYVTPSVRMAKSTQMQQVLCHMLPGHEVSVPVAGGPFEDDHGNPAWFAKGKGSLTPAKQILELKRDFLTSVAVALRAVKAHRPTVVVADGQGALIALGLANALCIETCLAMRNVQLPEIPPLARAWGAVRAVIVSTPRWGRAKLDVQLLSRAVPEMFDLTSPWEGLPTALVETKHSPLYSKEKELRWHAVDRFDNGFFDASGSAKERRIFVRVELRPCSAASCRIGTPARDMRGCQP